MMEKGKPDHLWRMYRWMILFLKPHTVRVALLVVLGVAAATGELVVPVIVQRFVNQAGDWQNAKQVIWTMLLIVGGVYLLTFAAKAAKNQLGRIVSEEASKDMYTSLLNHLRQLGIPYYEKHPAGDTLSLFQTEVGAAQYLFRSFPALIENGLFCLAAVACTISIHPLIGLSMVPGLLLFYATAPFVEKQSASAGTDVSIMQTAYNKHIYESISGTRELRSFNREEWDVARAQNKHDLVGRKLIKLTFYSNLRVSARKVALHLSMIGVFLYGSYLIRADEMSLGDFIAVLLLLSMAMFKLTVLVTQLAEQRMMLYKTRRIQQFLQEKPEITNSKTQGKPSTVKGAISLRNINFSYDPGGPDTLRGLSLDIEPGEKVAIVGTSGSGKSSLLKLIARFYDPDGGDVKLDGLSLKEWPLDQLRDCIGYVFQETRLYSSTLAENIRFGLPEASDEAVIDASRIALAHDFIKKKPEEYETLVHGNGSSLSGGQKQRIAIARMVLKNPAVVLLDEATSALDNETEAGVKKNLDLFLQNKTVVAVAHRLSTVRNFDRIVVLEHGQVADIGTYDQLMARSPHFRSIAEGLKREDEHEIFTMGLQAT